ncbi:MAG TPA: hypothetical protein PK718_05130 [Candidatus Methanofastidiosa archaeon]|nr:hypothetical protein [Candidatus Methanofastidiosa archaeon]HPR41914.1 hypothetical protein [Candidatus Methanofastidiosa archaeon]
MTSANRGSLAKREPIKSLGKSKARLFILEYMISKYDESVSHYEIVSRMHLPPIGMKRQDQIEHHIRELEEELGLIVSDYLKSGSSSIKVYRLRDDEASRGRVLLEIIDSPNRMDIFGNRYFRETFTREKVEEMVGKWRAEHERLLRVGIEEAEQNKGEEFGVRAHYDAVVRFISMLTSNDSFIDMIISMPVLTYMIMNGLDGAKTFWTFVEDLYHEYPELFSIEGSLLKEL